MKVNEATLRLFNSILLTSKIKPDENWNLDLLEKCLKEGFILSPEIQSIVDGDLSLLNTIKRIKGLSGEQANASFHKSWKIVKDTPQGVLMIQQIIHYFTTYGLEALGMYDERFVYLPAEELDIPQIANNIPITVIRGITLAETKEKIMELGSGIALSEDSLNDILTIIKCDKQFFDGIVFDIKNKELRSSLMEYYDITPSEPVEYLRFLVKKMTGSSMLIKSPEVINQIENSTSKFEAYLSQAPKDLASIFFRFKPLFLAMRRAAVNKSFFNRLRKQANRMHKPMTEDYLNSVTKYIRHRTIDFDKLFGELKRRKNIFMKIRLANALRFRIGTENRGICYRVRNGKLWATRDIKPSSPELMARALDIVEGSIAEQISEKVAGKTFWLPADIHYTIPTSEKQFIGNFPMGTNAYTGEKATIIGVHWTDYEGSRVDLDFSIISMIGKIGWDSSYKGDKDRVLFSGDVTSAPAPKGASELFYLDNPITNNYIVMLNFFNFRDRAKFKEGVVTAKLFVGKAKEHLSEIQKNYMIDPNDIMAHVDFKIYQKQQITGVLIKDRFYFTLSSMGQAISSYASENTDIAREYLCEYLQSLLGLEEILIKAGAKVVYEETEDCINLLPDNLDKTSIINILK